MSPRTRSDTSQSPALTAETGHQLPQGQSGDLWWLKGAEHDGSWRPITPGYYLSASGVKNGSEAEPSGRWREPDRVKFNWWAAKFTMGSLL